MMAIMKSGPSPWDLINQQSMGQVGPSNMPYPSPAKAENATARFQITKVTNGHILEMMAPGGKVTRIIPEGDDIGTHVVAALVSAKLEA